MTIRSRVAATVLAACACAAVSPAQQTWIVDQNNGPGTHFTSLPPAVVAAADGDTLLIRSGRYDGFSTGKALTLLGEGAVMVDMPFMLPWPAYAIEVTGLGAGKTFAMKNLTVSYPLDGGAVLRLRSNAGRIHLEDVVVRYANVGFGQTSACEVGLCNEVTMAGGSLTGSPALFASASTLALSSVRVQGGWPCGGASCAWVPATVGMTLLQCETLLSRTDVHGGPGGLFPFPQPGQPAIRMTGGSLVATGDAATQLRAGSGGTTTPTPALQTSGGTVELDTGIIVQGAQGGPDVAGTAVVTRRRVVSLTGQAAPPGGTATAEIVSPAGDAFRIVAGVAADPTPHPAGNVFVDPRVLLTLAVGVQGPTERFAVSVGVPNLPSLQGGVVALQAATFYAARSATGFSNPVVVVLH